MLIDLVDGCIREDWIVTMEDAPDNRELAHRIELLKKDFDVLKADISAKLDENKGAMDRLRADMERRDKENQRWIIGLFIATIVILGILIRWPAPPV